MKGSRVGVALMLIVLVGIAFATWLLVDHLDRALDRDDAPTPEATE